MKITNWAAGLLALAVFAVPVYGDEQSIPKDQIDQKKVYWGNCNSFTKAGKVDYKEIIKATPEFKTIKKDKIERGSGKYWILMSQASDRVVKALAYVGEESEYDLICASGYLKSLDPPVACDDLTQKIIKAMEKLMGD